MMITHYYSLVGCLVGLFVLVGGARQFSLENARAIAGKTNRRN
jgi:hypothetical protein